MKRPWKSRLIEFGLWTLLSLAVAFTLVMLSDSLLAPNF